MTLSTVMSMCGPVHQSAHDQNFLPSVPSHRWLLPPLLHFPGPVPQIGINIPVPVAHRNSNGECVFLAIGEGECDVILIAGAA